MAVETHEIRLHTEREEEVFDITGDVQEALSASKMRHGIACVFNPGSTGAITTIEYEPGLVEDLPAAMNRLFPRDITYEHEKRWHDGNGHSHVRASVVGPSLSLPFTDGRLVLGTWQQIVFVEFDNKPHRRRLIVQLVGE